MSDPNVKHVRLVGEAAGLVGGGVSAAAEDGTRRRRGGGRRNSRKILQVGTVSKEGGGSQQQGNAQQGGGATSPGTMVQLAATSVPGVAGGREPVGVNAPLTQKGSEVAPPPPPPIKPLEPGAPTGVSQAGGAAQKPVKVVLGAKKKAKVVLAPAVAKPAAAAAATPSPSKASRRTRKIKVSMRGLTKKIKKARTIRQKASDTTVDQIKKELHKAGLVKLDTKAPEPILRQMYADFMTLKSRAL